jgi:hypothetical protein
MVFGPTWKGTGILGASGDRDPADSGVSQVFADSCIYKLINIMGTSAR